MDCLIMICYVYYLDVFWVSLFSGFFLDSGELLFIGFECVVKWVGFVSRMVKCDLDYINIVFLFVVLVLNEK